MKSPRSVIIAAAALMALPVSVFCAQQSAQNKKPVPSLTSDDIIADRPVQPAETSSADRPKTSDQPKPADGKASAEEIAWREAVKKARKLADSTQRTAEDTELRVTELRNQLSASGQGPGDRNQTMNDLSATGDTLKRQKAEAREAADDLNKLLEDGRKKGFREEEGPSSVSKKGEANEDYYRSKFAELNQAMQDAERRVQLYQNRINELNQRISGNSRTGDNFYIGQLQQERDEAQHSLDQAREKSQKAQADINALKDQARAAGLPPGIFR